MCECACWLKLALLLAHPSWHEPHSQKAASHHLQQPWAHRSRALLITFASAFQNHKHKPVWKYSAYFTTVASARASQQQHII